MTERQGRFSTEVFERYQRSMYVAGVSTQDPDREKEQCSHCFGD